MTMAGTVHKRFWDDPNLCELDTTITAVEGDQVRLASTIFFAFSGGQESDAGSIGGHPVLDARTDGLDIVYRLAPGHGLVPGQAVQVRIDGARRRRLMRLHFAAELVLELAYRKLGAVDKIGAHISADKARIDFALPQSIAPMLADLAEQANAIIASDVPISCAFSDPATQRRYWEIAGLARVPCGGTHVRSTGEVGPIRLKRNNKGQGRERVEIFLAD